MRCKQESKDKRDRKRSRIKSKKTEKFRRKAGLERAQME